MYNYFHPIEVRYGDIDAQGHVNNAKYMTYMEHARISYFQKLGLWDGSSFMDIGVILADVRVTFKAAINLGQNVRVGARMTRLGNKSMDMEHLIEDQDTGQIMATGFAVLVTYDYHTRQTIPIPDTWRKVILEFEGTSDFQKTEVP